MYDIWHKHLRFLLWYMARIHIKREYKILTSIIMIHKIIFSWVGKITKKQPKFNLIENIIKKFNELQKMKIYGYFK